MKIYTRSGDRGTTSLFSGERVRKDDPRIEAYGDVDELNSAIGALVAALRSGAAAGREPEASEARALCAELEAVQSDLLRAGGWLASSPGAASAATLPAFDACAEAPSGVDCRDDSCARDPALVLEEAIDRLEARLDPLRQFILPGGDPAAAWAHLARCVCRRAERRLLALLGPAAALEHGAGAPQPAERVLAEQRRILVYLNRLSDYLFVVARTCNRLAGAGDRVWEP